MRTYVKLFRASESVSGRLAGLILSAGITFTQFNVLDTLFHLGPMRQRELSGKIMRSNGNVTLVLRNLERAGLVRRQRTVGTRRELTISLTDHGRALIAELLPRFARAVAREMSVLGDGELATLGALCRRVGLGKRRGASVRR